jgi:hypothetical protein
MSYFAMNKTINQYEAMQHLGIARLAARIFDLREDGVEVESEMIEVKNRFGDKCRISEYKLGAGE